MIGRTGTTRALSLISLLLLGAVFAPACGETDSDDDGAGGSAGSGGKATTGGAKSTTGGATAKGGATSVGGSGAAGGEAPTASGGKATAGSPGSGQGGEPASDGGEPGFPGFPGGGTTGAGGDSGTGDCDGVTPVDGEECEGFGTLCDVGDEVCACLPAGRGASEWSCTGGVDVPGAGGSGSVFDCEDAAPVDGEDCDGADVICQTDDGGVCACLGRSWSCFGGDTPGAGGAGFGIGGRQGAGGRNQGGRTGGGGRRSFGQGGA